MSVLAFSAGDLFRITIVKYLATNPERKWANNYEMRAKIAGTTPSLVAAGLVLVDFEKAFHFDPVVFDRLRLSTWEEDSKPYDPDVFVSLPLTAVGGLDEGGSDMEPLNMCWDIGRVPVSGRFGHVYYRGALVESEVTSPAGKATLASPSIKSGEITDALDDSGLRDYLDGTNVDFEMVMINKTGTQIRNVVTFANRGVAIVPFRHAWFNRTAPTP